MSDIRFALNTTAGPTFGADEDDCFAVLDGDAEPIGDAFLLPTHKEVCSRCRGEGVHDHPAFSNGLTQEDFDEDPDFLEDYRAGVYDVPCEECRGLRVVDVIDEDKLEPAVREGLHKWWREMADMRAIEAAERRAGA